MAKLIISYMYFQTCNVLPMLVFKFRAISLSVPRVNMIFNMHHYTQATDLLTWKSSD